MHAKINSRESIPTNIPSTARSSYALARGVFGRPSPFRLLFVGFVCIALAPFFQASFHTSFQTVYTSLGHPSSASFAVATPLFAQAPSKKKPAAKPSDPGKSSGDLKDGKDGKKPDAPAAKKAPEKRFFLIRIFVNAWIILEKGGLTMVGLILMAIIIMAFALERWNFFRNQKVTIDKTYFADVESALEKGGAPELRKSLADDDRLVSRILTAGLAYESEGAARVEKAIENAASVEVGNLERGLNLLSNLGNLAPLLGFFGTVVGMRVSFLQFVEKAAPTARDLAGGVEEALITTAAGLLVAIPTYLIYNLFIYRIDSFNIELERCAAAIFARIKS